MPAGTLGLFVCTCVSQNLSLPVRATLPLVLSSITRSQPLTLLACVNINTEIEILSGVSRGLYCPESGAAKVPCGCVATVSALGPPRGWRASPPLGEAKTLGKSERDGRGRAGGGEVTQPERTFEWQRGESGGNRSPLHDAHGAQTERRWPTQPRPQKPVLIFGSIVFEVHK